jgi:Uma2 family endonuclease
MSSTREITLPETKPATEWILGRAVQKVSPQRRHALIQATLASALLSWAMKNGAGMVGTEWEFRVTPAGEITRPLVPDIAFLSFDRLSFEEQQVSEIPYIAPDVAVEIVSPGDGRAFLVEKVRVYLAAGSSLVLVVDPKMQNIAIHDVHGTRVLGVTDTLEHAGLPGFSLRVGAIFEEPKPKKK